MSFIVAANWKMNKGPKETRTFFDEFKKGVASSSVRCLFFVSSVNASETAKALDSEPAQWGPQNFYPAANGAFTGESSPEVMQSLGATYALVGHSERRQLFGEKEELINEKVKGAQEFGLSPVLCIGETLEQRQQGETLSVLDHQLSKALQDVEISKALHIAYEPVWAIGTGEVATPEQVAEAHRFIRQFLTNRFPEQHKKINILYGGSVKPTNAGELANTDQVSGFLVGGASLKPESFLAIVEAAQA